MNHCTWLVDGKVLSISLNGHLDLHQIEALGHTVREKLNTSPIHQSLYLLIDASQLLTLPRAVGAVKSALSWLGNIDVACVIIHSSQSPTNCVLLRLAARARGIPCFAVGTESDAFAQLVRAGVRPPNSHPAGASS